MSKSKVLKLLSDNRYEEAFSILDTAIEEKKDPGKISSLINLKSRLKKINEKKIKKTEKPENIEIRENQLLEDSINLTNEVYNDDDNSTNIKNRVLNWRIIIPICIVLLSFGAIGWLTTSIESYSFQLNAVVESIGFDLSEKWDLSDDEIFLNFLKCDEVSTFRTSEKTSSGEKEKYKLILEGDSIELYTLEFAEGNSLDIRSQGGEIVLISSGIEVLGEIYSSKGYLEISGGATSFETQLKSESDYPELIEFQTHENPRFDITPCKDCSFQLTDIHPGKLIKFETDLEGKELSSTFLSGWIDIDGEVDTLRKDQILKINLLATDPTTNRHTLTVKNHPQGLNINLEGFIDQNELDRITQNQKIHISRIDHLFPGGGVKWGMVILLGLIGAIGLFLTIKQIRIR